MQLSKRLFNGLNTNIQGRGVFILAMESFQVNVPKEFLPLIDALEGSNLDEKVKVSLALGLFVNKQVTLARAAELSGKSLGEFIHLLRLKNIPWMEYTEDHLKDDERAIQELSGDERLEK